ncbi:MAG TPA: hypothetical protein G4O12_04850 [Dehalococcoidia bacterium]|nr:hypothetical protein [Dehalococcoidia bacterium]
MAEIPKSVRLITNKDIVKLGTNIVEWSLKSTGPINDAWPELTGEVPMSVKSNFIVRSEILWFFLHMMDRYSFAFGGPTVRDILQDAIVKNAIETMLTASFHAGQLDKKGFDEWIGRISSNAVEEFNDAQIDYSSCKTLGIENRGDFLNEETIIGRLAARIEHLTGQNYNLHLRLLIWLTITESLVKSELKKLVEKACRIVK